MTDTLLLVGSVVVGTVLGAGALWFFALRNKPRQQAQNDQAFVLMQQQMHHLTDTLNQKLDSVQKQMGDSDKYMQGTVREQFVESKRLIQDINKQMNDQLLGVNDQLLGVTKEVTSVKESSRQFLTVADQLKDLEKVLKHQKQRGNWGEASLKLALENFLPQDAFEMQYRFSDGEIVDAIIRTKDGLIPVDAKFSLDNYQRMVNIEDETARAVLEREFKNDLKKRIDETAKYIRPKEGTLPFAVMYIPAEGIYYDLLINDMGTTNSRKLIDYAYVEKNVVITSPTTFLAYLQTILYGFRAFKFEESIKHVQKNVEQLLRHLDAYEKHFKSVGKSLNTVVNHYEDAQTQYRLVDKDVLKITGDSNEYEVLALEHPRSDKES